MYQGVQGACPRQAVTSVGVTAERSERRDVGTGLKLVHSEFACYLSQQNSKFVLLNKLDLNDYDDVDLIIFLHCSWSRSLLLSGCFK